MATQAPVLVAPAMNIHMYANPILQENIRKLRRLGYHFMEPAGGYLMRLRGQRRLPEPEKIVEEIRRLLKKKIWLAKLLNTTRVPIRNRWIQCAIYRIGRRENGICAGSRGTRKRSGGASR